MDDNRSQLPQHWPVRQSRLPSSSLADHPLERNLLEAVLGHTDAALGDDLVRLNENRIGEHLADSPVRVIVTDLVHDVSVTAQTLGESRPAVVESIQDTLFALAHASVIDQHAHVEHEMDAQDGGHRLVECVVMENTKTRQIYSSCDRHSWTRSRYSHLHPSGLHLLDCRHRPFLHGCRDRHSSGTERNLEKMVKSLSDPIFAMDPIRSFVPDAQDRLRDIVQKDAVLILVDWTRAAATVVRAFHTIAIADVSDTLPFHCRTTNHQQQPQQQELHTPHEGLS